MFALPPRLDTCTALDICVAIWCRTARAAPVEAVRCCEGMSQGKFLLVGIVAVLVYGNTLLADFTFDDQFAVVRVAGRLCCVCACLCARACVH